MIKAHNKEEAIRLIEAQQGKLIDLDYEDGGRDFMEAWKARQKA